MSELILPTEILKKTPQKEPFYTEVKSALLNLDQGDSSDNPLFQVIHGYIGAMFEAGKLDDNWNAIHVNGGTLVLHKDFLKIQDNFSSLEDTVTRRIKWSAEKSVDALAKYISRMQGYRKKQISYFNSAIKLIPQVYLDKLQPLITNNQNLLKNEGNYLMVGIPSHFDNPELWESFNLKGQILDRIPTWAKVNERGVILASEIHRLDEPRGHDYFSYAARAVRDNEIENMSQKLLLTAQHEGSHGITDTIIINLLNLGSDNPIYEGIVGALGEDKRERKPSPSFEELIGNPCPKDVKIRQETTYYSGARYWESVRQIVSKRFENNSQVWPEIFKSVLCLGVDLSCDKVFMDLNENERVSIFLKKLPQKLNIEVLELENTYKSIAST